MLKKTDQKSTAPFSENLLKWYDANARPMPWRVAPSQSVKGIYMNPYYTWLSEVMLQQTQVVTVKEYFLKFKSKWPSVHDLAATDLEDVLKAWAGLGYYSRARNLKKCAEQIVLEHNGRFPETVDALIKLPGIGNYTASAISSIAFGKNVAVVDGNVERVITRQYCIDTPIKTAKPKVHAITQSLLSNERPGDFAQAMMDLGATLCSPKNPKCDLCPVSKNCQAFAKGTMQNYPVKEPKKAKPVRKGAAFVLINNECQIFLEKRLEKGLLAGMSQVPTTDWNSNKNGEVGIASAPKLAGQLKWQSHAPIRHTFTHFHLDLEVWSAECSTNKAEDLEGWWCDEARLKDEALPTVFMKVIKSALKA
ncbi:MAG: A/G-specific adenine glycosylase [Nitratireductor sp.]